MIKVDNILLWDSTSAEFTCTYVCYVASFYFDKPLVNILFVSVFLWKGTHTVFFFPVCNAKFIKTLKMETSLRREGSRKERPHVSLFWKVSIRLFVVDKERGRVKYFNLCLSTNIHWILYILNSYVQTLTYTVTKYSETWLEADFF